VVVAVCGSVLASLWLHVGVAAADAAPVFTADTPPSFVLDEVYGSANSCGSCSYNNQIGYAFAASGSPVPTYSVSSGALPTGIYLDPANGLLYGAPSSPGQSYSFSVSASNGVAPDAVAGPFTGTLGPPCPAGGSDGSTTTTTTSTSLVAANAVDVALPDVSAVVSKVVGRVIQNGVARVVYVEQVPVAVSDPGAQALLAAAAVADRNAAPGSSVAAPALASAMTTTSAPSQVGQIVPGPPLVGSPTVTSTVNVGPVTLGVGSLQSCTFVVSSGSEDIDTLVSSPQASATDEEQSTATTTSVYVVDATVGEAKLALSNLRETKRKWQEGKVRARISASKRRKHKKKPAAGTIFSFDLDEAARVTFTFTKLAKGRKVHKRCVAPTKKNKHKRRCARSIVAGRLTFSAHAGANKVTFDGLIANHKKLKPGSYTVHATATASGESSTSNTLHFKIKRPRHRRRT
jgi:hypothetical protein